MELEISIEDLLNKKESSPTELSLKPRGIRTIFITPFDRFLQTEADFLKKQIIETTGSSLL